VKLYYRAKRYDDFSLGIHHWTSFLKAQGTIEKTTKKDRRRTFDCVTKEKGSTSKSHFRRLLPTKVTIISQLKKVVSLYFLMITA